MTISGHFDGERIVLDEPVPCGVAPDTPVHVTFDTNGTPVNQDAAALLDEISRLAVDDDDLPADFAEQHEHYVKGSPKR